MQVDHEVWEVIIFGDSFSEQSSQQEEILVWLTDNMDKIGREDSFIWLEQKVCLDH